VTEQAAARYQAVRDSGLTDDLQRKGWLIGAEQRKLDTVPGLPPNVRYLIEHPPVPFLSYPYEWPFSALKAAALLHLNIQLQALEKEITLSDATAFNVQFIGPHPVFFDLLSFRPYRDGELWAGHRQFCAQFLNPLLLASRVGAPFHDRYRGNMEGISAEEIDAFLPWWRKLAPRALLHVHMQARLQRSALTRGKDGVERARRAVLPKNGFAGLLRQLRKWIESLEPCGTDRTEWSDYAETRSYDAREQSAKDAFVAEFVEETKPSMLWDLGCNRGDHAEMALGAGADYVIGFDMDRGALERAFKHASNRGLRFLPLYQDAFNPSPDQGWDQSERRGLRARAKADAIISLAFAHHLAIGRNVPLPQLLRWITSLAPAGVLEFVPKGDAMVQQMLALREDIFPDYSQERFERELRAQARIIRRKTVSASGRCLYRYHRT
jgi:ribosomal protein L11 methylase PrmA